MIGDHTTWLPWVEIGLLVAWIAASAWGFHVEAVKQRRLVNEVELLNERLDRAGLPHRLPVHVITGEYPPPTPPAAEAVTTVMPVVGRHRRPSRGEVAGDAAVVDVDD